MSKLQNEYNINTPQNVINLMFFIFADFLWRAKLSPEEIEKCLNQIGNTTNDIIAGRRVITSKGITPGVSNDTMH